MTHLRCLYTGRAPSRALAIADLRAMALRRLPGFVAEFLEGGAEDENTLAANLASFAQARFAPRVLTGPPPPSGIRLFGQDLPLPLVIAPTGFNALHWHEGDLALARAAARAGVPFTQSTVSNATIEQVAATGARHWFQLYAFRDRGASAALVERARQAGAAALVITVDAQLYGKRAWNTRLYRGENALRWPAMLDAARHPRWMAQVWARGMPGFANLYPFLPQGQSGLLPSARWVREAIDPALDWSILGWARQHWSGPLIVKGIGHPEDAARALAKGADGIVLSNHGGRQLDGALPALDLVAAVRDRLGDGPTVLIDGGARRGVDLAIARARGADAVMTGRATLYGLAAAGEAGVARALSILAEEYALAQGLIAGGPLWPPQGA
ncbi:alpha-hydroxy acid oxidase [Novosphingobium sp.]|uniref:alpha-hydroxy acid oxidase n=1 Tax=Novosphingobium sp. TaxID=1874826 RepID=UPI0031CDFF7C